MRLIDKLLQSFNPRTPAGCDSSRKRAERKVYRFNPRTPAGCDLPPEAKGLIDTEVSIHAPLRGATNDTVDHTYNVYVSIHAPLRGATITRYGLRVKGIPVSIHAPLRGATCSGHNQPHGPVVSIHAPLRGATGRFCRICRNIYQFQSTHPCGVRLGIFQVILFRLPSVNPRTPAGCDLRNLRNPAAPRLFQSTHPCGVRRKDVARKLFNEGFQSTHPCGVRLRGAGLILLPQKFQSTHPCGVRRV